jgi:hypothetical protein
VHLVQAIWPLPPNAPERDVDSAQSAADALGDGLHGCADFQHALPNSSFFRDFGWVLLDDMPAEIRAIAANQPIGVPTAGIRDDGGVAVFVVCGRRSVGITPEQKSLLIPISVVPKLGFDRTE